nr:uncharacterized protein LOC126527738 [Dermacentor andersoni]
MKMLLAYALAIFLTSITVCVANAVKPSVDEVYWVYLSRVAEAYINIINATKGGNVISWGFTGDYPYWTHSHPREKHPVKASVDARDYLECRGTDTLNAEEANCAGFFTWIINGGISSPFSAEVDGLVPVLCSKLQKRRHVFDVNGLTIESADEMWGSKSGPERRKFVQVLFCMANGGT